MDSVLHALSVLTAASIILLVLLYIREATKTREYGNASKIQHLRELSSKHEIAQVLSNLIEIDGAGAWPPRCDHDDWPLALLPYKDIYLELVPLLSAAEVSLDDIVNSEKRNHYRSLFRKLLAERINIAEVESILSAVEAGRTDVLPQKSYNGFYCCVAVCRHAYRWATIPVVKVAQSEKVVDFPPELDVPWPYLQRRAGVTAESGNNTSNVLYNFNERGERVYKINTSMNDVIRSSEECFFGMFYTLEVLAFPVYYSMIRAVVAFDEDDKISCLNHLKDVTSGLRDVLLVFYENLKQSRVSRDVWLSYVQGFQGWGVGRFIDGEYIKYDGLSGNHVLFFQAIDAFLGMDRYLTDENMNRYIPVNQRNLCLALKKLSFRNRLSDTPEDKLIQGQYTMIVNHMKVFRTAHKTRVMPYLEQPAPERFTMTAGKSVLDKNKETREALKVLDEMLATRLKETT